MKKIAVISILVGLGWWFWGRTLEPAKVVHAQLEAIANHDYQTAYTLLSANAKSRMTPEQFTELIQSNKVVNNNYTSDFLDRHMKDNVATFSGTVRALGKEKIPAVFTVVKEGDRWAIEDFRFN
jgi:hypothetical protein